eukprot:1681335-Rhodomonas_salina.2
MDIANLMAWVLVVLIIATHDINVAGKIPCHVSTLALCEQYGQQSFRNLRGTHVAAYEMPLNTSKVNTTKHKKQKLKNNTSKVNVTRKPHRKFDARESKELTLESYVVNATQGVTVSALGYMSTAHGQWPLRWSNETITSVTRVHYANATNCTDGQLDATLPPSVPAFQFCWMDRVVLYAHSRNALVPLVAMVILLLFGAWMACCWYWERSVRGIDLGDLDNSRLLFQKIVDMAKWLFWECWTWVRWSLQDLVLGA